MEVLIVYESRGGRTRRAAEAVADAIRARGSEATVKTLKDTTAEDVERSNAIAVGSWVEGFVFFKVGPAKGALEGVGRLPGLGGKPAAVFCTYGFSPRATLATLRQSLETKGAMVVAENASHRSHPDRGAAELAERICASSEGS
ncbi:MAG: flavodoxin family protein [Acidimicrobiales bacterium]